VHLLASAWRTQALAAPERPLRRRPDGLQASHTMPAYHTASVHSTLQHRAFADLMHPMCIHEGTVHSLWRCASTLCIRYIIEDMCGDARPNPLCHPPLALSADWHWTRASDGAALANLVAPVHNPCCPKHAGGQFTWLAGVSEPRCRTVPAPRRHS